VRRKQGTKGEKHAHTPSFSSLLLAIRKRVVNQHYHLEGSHWSLLLLLLSFFSFSSSSSSSSLFFFFFFLFRVCVCALCLMGLFCRGRLSFLSTFISNFTFSYVSIMQVSKTLIKDTTTNNKGERERREKEKRDRSSSRDGLHRQVREQGKQQTGPVTNSCESLSLSDGFLFGLYVDI